MSLARSLSLSGLSTLVRLCAAIVTFAVVARVLGPKPFGELMLYLSIGTLLSIVSNYGLTVLLMREIGRRPQDARQIFANALSAKLITTAVTMVAMITVLPFINGASRLAFLCMVFAMLSEASCEFLNAAFRASSRFDLEAKLALKAACINSASVGIVAALSKSLDAIALAYAISRGIVVVMTWSQINIAIGKVWLAPLSAGLKLVRSATSYAVDAGLTAAFGQIDSIALNHYLGPSSVGIYQAGMRLFMAGMQSAGILANVFLPRAAAAQASNPTSLTEETGRLQGAFLSVGAGFGLILAIGGGHIVRPIFGPGYDALVPLMPWFGLLFAMKFAAAAWGIVLTARGRQSYRAIASGLHWIVILIVAMTAVPSLGSLGWLMSLVAGNSVLCILYAARAASGTQTDARTLGFTGLMLAAFVPMLRWP